jgi:hypothetical protein
MPNWVLNTLKVVAGDPKEISEFVRTEKSVFDFNTLVPMPEHIQNSNEEVARPSGFTVPAWYSWAIANWGTKWNASESRYSTTNPQSVIWFDTAWDPPVPVFEALAKGFPEHEILIYSDEYTNHLQMTFILKEGCLTWTQDACHCFDEDQTPPTWAELNVFGIKEAP